MRRFIILVTLIMCFSLLFTGCSAVTNILDPLPDDYVDGVKVPREYPDEDLEIYDDAVVFELEEDDEEILLKFGTEDDIDDIADFYTDLFEDNELTIEEQEDDRKEFYAKGKGYGFRFEINAEEASGNYEQRAFTTVVEVDIEFYTVGEETLKKMQGFWLGYGANGEIDDIVKDGGYAVEFRDITMDIYEEFETTNTNIEFEFINDDTIKIIEDGVEEIIDVTFETIDGAEVMTLIIDSIPIHFEKSTYEKMMEYYVVGSKTLEKMQGFWLVCGINGEITDRARKTGSAYEFEDMAINAYYGFKLKHKNNIFEFVDDDTIKYSEGGVENITDISFETVDGIEVMTILYDDDKIHFEKSSYEDMMLYAEMAGEDVEAINNNNKAADLTDEEFEEWISDIDWLSAMYISADGSEFAQDYESFRFNSADHTGIHEDTDGTEEITSWYVLDGKIYIEFPDRTYYGRIEFLYRAREDFSFLYLADTREGYEGNAFVYMTTKIP